MMVYEFYRFDPIMGYQLIGILPERRKNSARITQKSILNWGNKFFANQLDIAKVKRDL